MGRSRRFFMREMSNLRQCPPRVRAGGVFPGPLGRTRQDRSVRCAVNVEHRLVHMVREHVGFEFAAVGTRKRAKRPAVVLQRAVRGRSHLECCPEVG